RPRAVLSVSPQSWLTEGDSVTLSCEVTDSSTDWTFSWYTVVPYRDGLTGINNNRGYGVYVELLSDSSRGSGGNYTLSPAALNHTGVYMCRGQRGEPALHTQYSNPQPLWITAEFPPVSLIINPSRTQHFSNDSLSLSCEDQSNSTGWTVRRYTHSERVLDCSHWGSVTGSTCNISFLSTSYTGVYWCETESGENSNPVNITVHDGDVILESPVYPVTEGHPLTLRCLYHNPNPSNLRADFYKDGSVLQNQTTGEIIQTVSKSDEGFYHCKHPERGESPKSWLSVRCPSGVEAPFSVLMLICSVVMASPYLLVTFILLVICYRARVCIQSKLLYQGCLLHTTLNHLDNRKGNYLEMIRVDYRSAFNTKIPFILTTKLGVLNLALCQWISNVLTDRPQAVQVGRHVSPSLTLSTGAPKGCVSSPMLYLLYSYDCVATSNSTIIVKFANDIFLVGLISDNNEKASLEEVKSLESWHQENNLFLNIRKTKELMVDFSRKQERKYQLVKLNGPQWREWTCFKHTLNVLTHYVIAYINDILIYSSTYEEHVHHVRSVLTRLLLHKLYVKAEKCGFH
ncbi:hypothetical protein QTP70_025747, partial [Hemibagrus guttatus]